MSCLRAMRNCRFRLYTLTPRLKMRKGECRIHAVMLGARPTRFGAIRLILRSIFVGLAPTRSERLLMDVLTQQAACRPRELRHPVPRAEDAAVENPNATVRHAGATNESPKALLEREQSLIRD